MSRITMYELTAVTQQNGYGGIKVRGELVLTGNASERGRGKWWFSAVRVVDRSSVCLPVQLPHEDNARPPFDSALHALRQSAARLFGVSTDQVIVREPEWKPLG